MKTKPLIARRPKFRQTVRTQAARLCFYDASGQRWVIYRRAGGITRKTSLRGPAHDIELADLAHRIAARLKRCPVNRLATFNFKIYNT